MNVPKWLVPIISVVAALAVGVAMAFVGANFASRQVADQPAKTLALPVLAPVATANSTKDAAKLASDGKLPVSKVTGQATVVRPGATLGASGLRQAVAAAASGHASGDGADTPGTPTGSTPSPTPSPSAAPGGVSGTGGSPTANDPCSPAAGNPPDGCPSDTLHGAIFADTVPPALDFSISPFDARCGTTSTANADRGFVDVPVTFRPTIPASFNVQWSILTDDSSRSFISGWSESNGIPTHSDEVARWNDAAASDTPVPGLPPLSACFTVPHVDHAGVIIDLVVDAFPAPNATSTIRHEYLFRVGGPSVLPQVEAETFVSHDYFVAYTETIPGHAVDIRAYRITQTPGATCADVSHLPELSAQGERLIGTVNPRSTTLDIPLDYTQRVALGFVVPPGSVILVCAKWYHGHEVPSFDRGHPFHTSSIIERAPDALLPFLTVVQVNAQGTGAMDVTASGSTIEGINCGSAQVQLNSVPLVGDGHDFERRICSETPSAMDSATNDPAYRGEMVVTSDVERRGGQHILGQFVIPNPTTVCDDCRVPPEDTFQVPLPDAPGTSNSMGTLTVVRGWDISGRSGLRNWISEPQISVDATDIEPANLPQLNTDPGLVVDSVDAVAPGPTLKFDLSADQSVNYSVTLTGLPGSTTCTLGSIDLTVTGHYSIGSRPAPVVFAHLCYDTVYLARVTLTGENGTTEWGFQSGNNLWPRYLAVTPSGSVQISVSLTVDDHGPPPLIDGIAMDLDGHTGAVAVPINAQLTCTTGNEGDSDYRTVPVSGNTVTFHLHYQLRNGTEDTTDGRCTVIPGEDQPPVDFSTELSLQALAGAGGVSFRQGPFTFTVNLGTSS